VYINSWEDADEVAPLNFVGVMGNEIDRMRNTPCGTSVVHYDWLKFNLEPPAVFRR